MICKPSTGIRRHIGHIVRIDIRIPRSNLAHTPTHRVLLCPAAQLRIVVAGAELVQVRIGVVVATSELPGVAHRLALIQAVAIGVVVVAVLDGATAIDHFEHRAEIVHQVIIRPSCRPFTHELPCIGTSVIRRRRASRSIHTQAQRTIDRAGPVVLHTVGLVGSTVAVAVVVAAGTDTRRLVLVVDAEGAACSRQLIAVAIIAVGRGGAVDQTAHQLVGTVVAVGRGHTMTGGRGAIACSIVGIATAGVA